MLKKRSLWSKRSRARTVKLLKSTKLNKENLRRTKLLLLRKKRRAQPNQQPKLTPLKKLLQRSLTKRVLSQRKEPSRKSQMSSPTIKEKLKRSKSRPKTQRALQIPRDSKLMRNRLLFIQQKKRIPSMKRKTMELKKTKWSSLLQCLKMCQPRKCSKRPFRKRRKIKLKLQRRTPKNAKGNLPPRPPNRLKLLQLLMLPSLKLMNKWPKIRRLASKLT